MINVRSIKSRALKAFVEKNDASKINANWRTRVRRILTTLNQAGAPEEMDVPGFGFHELKGARQGTFAVLVTRNWRITFRWSEEGPCDVDLEDYHG
jgi:proteic killer suppression protein